MYKIKTAHCPDCSKLIRYNGVLVFALLIHYRLKHTGWTPLFREAINPPQPRKVRRTV